MASNKFIEANDKIAKAVTGAYKKVESDVVSGYKTVEKAAVDGYAKVEDVFVGKFFTTFITPKSCKEYTEASGRHCDG